jgi:4-alpha-glucanotransferase
LRTGGRVAGVTLPLSSLRSARDWGIGQITDLPRCAAWVLTGGQRLLQILPAYELAAGENSPYGARTAFGLDPIYIDVEAVPDLSAEDLHRAMGQDRSSAIERLRQAPRVDFGAVRPLKERALGAAFEAFMAREWKSGTPRSRSLAAFIAEERGWEDPLALYVALRERRGGWSWENWPDAEKHREPSTLFAARAALGERMLFHQYCQWIAHEQWVTARREVNALGVELMGDVPFIVGHESADVWARTWQFRRDVSLGAPPDAFSEDGQDWGLPAYDWVAMDRDDLDWLRRRTRRAAQLYDRFRLDHVVGYFRMYVKRMGDKRGVFDPAEEPDQLARGSRVMRAMMAEAGGARLIAEDLGVIPPFVREALTELGVPGYRVIPWENDDGRFRDPRSFPSSSVATWSTHDTAPITTWWDELPESAREQLGAFAGIGADASPHERWLPLLRLVLSSGSDLSLMLASEILGRGERINTPATVGGENWTYRLPMTLEDLARDPDAVGRMSALKKATLEHGR